MVRAFRKHSNCICHNSTHCRARSAIPEWILILSAISHLRLSTRHVQSSLFSCFTFCISFRNFKECLILNEKTLKSESGKDPSVKEIIRCLVACVQIIYNIAPIASVGRVRYNKIIFDYHCKQINIVRINIS